MSKLPDGRTTTYFGMDPATGQDIKEGSFVDFLQGSSQLGGVEKIDWKVLPEELRRTSNNYVYNQSNVQGDTPDYNAPAYTLNKDIAAKYKDWKIRDVGVDQNSRYFDIVRPDGKTQRLTMDDKNTDTWFDNFMYSGGPIALMAAPILGPAIGGALGLSGTAATAVGAGLTNAGFAAINGQNPLRAGLAGGLSAGLTAIPGFSKLPTALQGAVRGAVSSGVASKGDPRTMLLSAIMGGVTPGAKSGMTSAGITNNLAQQLAIAALRQKLAGAIGGRKP